ncbi:hypothetical protein ACFLT2_12725, partial [Acidobacteriota bacterium]
MRSRIALLLTLVFILSVSSSALGLQTDDELISNDELKKDAPRVYVDCHRCDRDYIRTEITFVNYVRDRMDADVHILITTQRTGSGGTEYTMEFIGRRDFAHIGHKLIYITDRIGTRDEVRKGMVEVLKRGLFPYVMHSPIAKYIKIVFDRELEPTAVEDKWNFWIFNIGLDGFLEGEQSRQFRSISGNISASRVTPEMKLRLGVSGNFNEDSFEIDGEEIVSTASDKEIRGMYVKSLSDHWSAGGWAEVESETYSNMDLQFNIAPAIEYNVYPYYESTRRQLRFLYRLNFYINNYMEETIFGKMSENLFGQSLRATLEVRQPWGNVSVSVDGSHYFHDISKYRLGVRGWLSVRLVRGLNLDIWGRYSRIHDQVNLPTGEASIDEVLLRRRELATGYDYRISVGLSYTFGS